MIIGINGYIGSGKDTVGALIQLLIWRERNKEAAAVTLDEKNLKDWLACPQRMKEEASCWQIKKFAGKLKQIASLMLGVPVEKFEDQEFKKSFLGPEWSFYWTVREEPRMTVREFLQRLGTEAIRDGLHENAWVNALFADYKPYQDYVQGKKLVLQTPGHIPDEEVAKEGFQYPNWIITDMRFPNEMQAVKDRGGITIKIVRDLPEAPYETLEQRHPSETALNGKTFDYIIYNDGTLKDLTEYVRVILNSRGLLHENISENNSRQPESVRT